jgi:hypothetical protein
MAQIQGTLVQTRKRLFLLEIYAELHSDAKVGNSLAETIIGLSVLGDARRRQARNDFVPRRFFNAACIAYFIPRGSGYLQDRQL